ncbi:MAG: hypothetical protein ACREXX_10805 [Gammaproteobacteria bacterium]
MTLPGGEAAARAWDREPTPLQRALARAHQSGEVKSLRELARKEGVKSSYVSRMVNLTTLAPDIIVASLDESVSQDVTLA